MISELANFREQYTTALRHGDEAAARIVVENLTAVGIDTHTIYYEVFAPSMVQIGEMWERNEITVAEEHLATAITERLIGQLSFAAGASDHPEQGVVLVGCVAGERHELGLRMLADLLRQAGWRVLYLGGDVPTADWVQLAIRTHADAVAISAGAQRHISTLRSLIDQLRSALPKLQVLVGGAVFTRNSDLWRSVGATLHNSDPIAAVEQLVMQKTGTDRLAH